MTLVVTERDSRVAVLLVSLTPLKICLTPLPLPVSTNGPHKASTTLPRRQTPPPPVPHAGLTQHAHASVGGAVQS